ncbi:MAG: response regulator transcription factor [Rubrivivax sp.]|nr:response regulator transcription factor [Rubrivivax sp.]
MKTATGPEVSIDAFIAEDEPPALERLLATPARTAPQVRVRGHADSVRGTLAWLAANPAPGLLLLDIQLADGLSLELFERAPLTVPTIFTTAYDRFAIDAFRALAVDYLLKPVTDEALAAALGKLQRLRAHFGADVARVLGQRGAAAPAASAAAAASAASAAPFRERLLGRKGNEFVTLPVARLAYVVSVDKLSFAVDAQGQRCLLEGTLAELEAELDPARFFRVNRQLLVAAEAVVRFVAAGKGRLKVELRPALPGDVLVSQERAADFKVWLGG